MPVNKVMRMMDVGSLNQKEKFITRPCHGLLQEVTSNVGKNGIFMVIRRHSWEYRVEKLRMWMGRYLDFEGTNQTGKVYMSTWNRSREEGDEKRQDCCM